MDCIIIDDEETARYVLYKLCSKVKNLNVKKDFDNAISALDYLDKHTIDVVFLDLHMPNLSGYQFIDALKEQPKIILTTSDRNTAIKAFEYSCIVDFLGKPFSLPRFIHAVDKVNRIVKLSSTLNKTPKIHLHAPKDLYVNIDKRLVKIHIESITYIKTSKKHILIKTCDKTYIIKSSLIKILNKLPASSFLRVHQSYIINLSKIIDIKNNSILIDKDSIPVSRLNRLELKKRLNLF